MTEAESLPGAFHCRHCGAFARHDYSGVYLTKSRIDTLRLAPTTENAGLYERISSKAAYGHVLESFITVCEHCSRCTIWMGNTAIYPVKSEAPPVHPQTPEHIVADYKEASLIIDLSPRGACALVRLALQKLLQHLGGNTGSIDGDIRAMALAGMSPTLVKALDSVRITGNEAVHPGTLDIGDQPDLARSMFALFNVIVEQMIAVPNEIAAVYAKLPESKTLDAERRDAAALRRKSPKQPTG